MRIFLTLLIFIVYQPGFSQNRKAEAIDVHGFKKVIPLVEVLRARPLESEIFLINGITSDSKYMYIHSRKEQPIVKAYRIKDGKYMGGFGTIGQGPGEYQRFNASSFNARNGQLITQDSKYVRIFSIVESGDQLEFKKVLEQRLPREIGTVNQGFLVDDGNYAGSIMFTEKDFILFSLTDNLEAEISGFGDYPNLYPDIPSTAYHHLYQGSSSYGYEGMVLARFYNRVPLIRVFNLPKGDYLDIPIKPKHQQIDKIVPDPRGRSISNGMQMIAYLSRTKLSKDFIVATYEERTFKKVAMTEKGNMESIPLTDKVLLVINRNGKLLAKLSPPDWMETFHITPENLFITFHPEEADKFYTLDLNDLDR